MSDKKPKWKIIKTAFDELLEICEKEWSELLTMKLLELSKDKVNYLMSDETNPSQFDYFMLHHLFFGLVTNLPEEVGKPFLERIKKEMDNAQDDLEENINDKMPW